MGDLIDNTIVAGVCLVGIEVSDPSLIIYPEYIFSAVGLMSTALIVLELIDDE